MVKWHVFLLALFISSRFVSQDITASASTCVTPPAENVQLDTTVGYAEAIQNYLSAGGDPVQLKSLLQPLGVMPDPTMSDGVYVLDLTGDSKNDLIVNIALPAELPYPPDTSTFVVWIYLCQGAIYGRVYETDFHQSSKILDQGMFIDSIQDLNHDSRPEVVYHARHCGMYCFMDLYIAGWSSTIQRIHQMLSYSFQVGDYTFTDTDGDGIFDVVITSGNGGAAGDGPLRKWQTTFGWDGINFTIRRSVPEAPQQNFEAAQDAAAALHMGDFQTAAILYQKILDGHTFFVIDDGTDGIYKSQALFGLLIIRMVQGDRQTADEIYAELQATQGIPDQYIGATTFSETLWTQVGRTFYSLAQQHDLSEACDAVVVELNAARSIKPGSHDYPSSYWGHFGNPPKPEAMCPF